jgi:hypothetical protein
VRHHRAHPERAQHGVTGVVGVLGDRDERPVAGQHRARPDEQHREHAVADPSGRPRVRDHGQGVDQGQRAQPGTKPGPHLIKVNLHMVKGSTIGEDDSAGTGFQT